MARTPLLDKRIAYQFKSGALREQALTHRSFGSPHNERLEFLGDGVLGCVIAEELFARFPSIAEGELTKLRASLVRKETLSDLAEVLGLSEFLRAGRLGRPDGRSSTPAMLADTLEAIYGAVFLDGGYAAARDVIQYTFKGKLSDLDPRSPPKDAKTQLQEFVQGRKNNLPEYRVISTEGAAHSQTIEVECVVEEMHLRATGSGSTRRIAEQNAAGSILKQIDKTKRQIEKQ